MCGLLLVEAQWLLLVVGWVEGHFSAILLPSSVHSLREIVVPRREQPIHRIDTCDSDNDKMSTIAIDSNANS